MHWFKGVAWNDMVLAAVACISPLGVWLPFWFDHRQKTRERRQRQLGELERLRIRLRDTIQPWANEWPDDSYNPDWYRPDWHVLPFEWDHVETFNRLVIAGDYPAELTAVLVRLEEAARRFHAVLAAHDERRGQVPVAVVQNFLPIYAAGRERRTPLSNAEIGALAPGLNQAGLEWIIDLFESNRRIHVEAIGRRDTPDGLFATFRAVADSIDGVERELRAGRDPWWYVWGHTFAGILAVTGFLFLGDFWWSFVEGRFREGTNVAAARSDTTSKPAPTHAPVISATVMSQVVKSDTTRASIRDTAVNDAAKPAKKARGTAGH